MRIKQEKLWSAYNMEKTENAVRSRLLEAGKEEFRDRGFLKASLRAICKKADVTTGALYFFFESKAALFEEIVKETVEKLKELTGDFSNREKQLQPEEYDRILMEFIWENRDIARILMDGAEGTRYDNFREDTCIRMEQFLRENLQKKCGKEVDSDLVHILAETKLQGYSELLRGDYSKEKFMEIFRIAAIGIITALCVLVLRENRSDIAALIGITGGVIILLSLIDYFTQIFDFLRRFIEKTGIDGSVMMQRVSGSFRVPVPDEMNVDPVDGIDVVTTLDVDIQDVAEKALRDQLIAMQADWGTAILMEVATGEIRAMANLTRYSDERVVEDFNYAIGMNLEPGSTEKLASLITLLDDAGASLDETYDTGDGRIVIGRAKVVDSHACGLLTLKGVFEKSSNVGFAMAVNKYYRDDPKRFVDHLCKMGLDQPLGLQIAGEQKPVIRKPGDKWWDGTTLTMMSYGYALRLTPLKTLTFYNAVANGGKMVSPLLVKELRQYGQTLRTFGARTMVSSIASRETLEEVREAMRGVVEEGTARRMRSRYYSVGGKTGTAQIAMGRSGYTDRNGGRHYLGTFVGYFPEDDPKYSCLVAVKTYNAPGHRRYYYGGTVAGPVFKAIADRVYVKNTAWQKPVSETGDKSAKKPFVKAGRVEQMREVGYRFDIPYEGRRREKPWKELASIDSTGAVYTEYDERGGKVPCVVGMGLKDAIYLLERQGMSVSFSGAGTVLSQSVPAGSKARRGQTVSLILGVEPLPEGETVRHEKTRRTE